MSFELSPTRELVDGWGPEGALDMDASSGEYINVEKIHSVAEFTHIMFTDVGKGMFRPSFPLCSLIHDNPTNIPLMWFSCVFFFFFPSSSSSPSRHFYDSKWNENL
jgi:hypothetical protein